MNPLCANVLVQTSDNGIGVLLHASHYLYAANVQAAGYYSIERSQRTSSGQ